MEDRIRLGRIGGVPIGADYSLVVMVGVLTFLLATGPLPSTHPGFSTAVYWAAALLGAGLFFASVLAHELAHAVLARRAGITVEGITLWILGGMARMRSEPRSPGWEAAIAVIGPLTSIAAGVVFLGARIVLDALGTAPVLVSVLSWLALANVIIGLFNLLPGLPLDGGRVLHAVVWWRTGDRVGAGIAAATAGVVLGGGIVALGLLITLQGGFGLITMLVGFFVIASARANVAALRTERALVGRPVSEVMSGLVVHAPHWASVDSVLEHPTTHDASLVAIDRDDGSVGGVVWPAGLRRLPDDERRGRRVDEVWLALEGLPVVGPGDHVADALARMTEVSVPAIVVRDGEAVVGVLTGNDLQRALRAPRPAPSEPAPPPRPVG